MVLISPRSDHFDDHYFCQSDGLGETQYVFFNHNHLSERFKDCQHFHIGETGFGTGLSFCLSAELFLETAPSQAQLHFFSCEKHPLQKDDSRLVWHLLPDSDFAQQLAEQYPTILPEGHHAIVFGRITLHLLIGDACEQFDTLTDSIDAWFLDGFSPKVNPEMWCLELVQILAKLSHAQTTFATYTAAGDVRRNLMKAGFKVQKDKGFGQKREMLYGQFSGDATDPIPNWYAKPTVHQTQRVAILGAGIAGLSCAYELSQAGIICTVYDPNPIASGASGNPLGLVRPHLTRDNSLSDQFLTQGALQTLSLLKRLRIKAHFGVLQLAINERLIKRYQGIANDREDLNFSWLAPEQCAELCGQQIDHPGLHITAAAMLSPQALCKALLKNCHDNTIVIHEAIDALEWDGKQWKLSNGTCADAVILCQASDALKLEQCQGLPLKAVGGELTYCESDLELPDLKLPLCYEGYALPAGPKQWILGATFQSQANSQSANEKPSAGIENLKSLSKAIPNAHQQLQESGTRLSVRCVSPDHLPLVGPLGTESFIQQHYQRQVLGDLKAPCPRAQYHPNLFVSLGHGSKGLSSALLSARIIKAYLTGSAMPISKNVLLAVHPSRFWVRQTFKTPGETNDQSPASATKPH